MILGTRSPNIPEVGVPPAVAGASRRGRAVATARAPRRSDPAHKVTGLPLTAPTARQGGSPEREQSRKESGQSLNSELSSALIRGYVTDAGVGHSQGRRTSRTMSPAGGRGHAPWSRPSAACIVVRG
jgi:hypothetical protein